MFNLNSLLKVARDFAPKVTMIFLLLVLLAATAVAQTSNPTISSIGGFTSPDAGISNGLVAIPTGKGTLYNGNRVINDQPGVYTWTIAGSNFGAARGTVMIGNQQVPIVAWSNTSITVNPSGSIFNAQQPWNWGPMCVQLTVRKSTGQQSSAAVNVVPAVRTRIFGQCTCWVARRRLEMGLQPSASAYAGYTAISTAWVPQRGDQLQWAGFHQAIIESVQGNVAGNVTTFSITISQYNATARNEYGTFTTSFQITRQPNGARVVTQLPKFSTNSIGASSYYR